MKKIGAAIRLLDDFAALLFTIRSGLRERPFVKPFGRPGFQGGPMTKFLQIQPIAADRNAPYSAVFCFSSVSVPLFLLRVLKLFGVRVLVNQNGVYYPAWYPKGYQRKNRYLRRLNALADHSFFQSRFALESYREWVGAPPVNHSILHNGVDLVKFYPDESRARDSARVRLLVFTDVSEFTRPVWRYVLGLMKSQEVKGVSWVFAGRILSPETFQELGLDGLGAETHFDVPPGEVPALLRGCDLALHLIYNDVCPNKVLECLASGVWVIGTATGGTEELLEGTGAVLSVARGYGEPQFPPHQALAAAIAEFSARPETCLARARAQAERFGIEDWYRTVEKA